MLHERHVIAVTENDSISFMAARARKSKKPTGATDTVADTATAESVDARHELGRFGERHAVKLLRRAGYRVVARNVHSANAEIDIIATRRTPRGEPPLIVFVEVRARTAGATVRPEDSVNVTKQRHVIAGAREYMHRQRRADAVARFDVIAIEVDTSGRKPKVVRADHYEAAFDAAPRGRRR